jgi:hypothetical protein
MSRQHKVYSKGSKKTPSEVTTRLVDGVLVTRHKNKQKINSGFYLPKSFVKDKRNPKKIVAIDGYIAGAEYGINQAQNAIILPLDVNFDHVRKTYENWVLDVVGFLKKVRRPDEANIVLASPDGVHTILNAFPGRSKNIAPSFTYEKRSDGRMYVDDAGIEILKNIRQSFRDKIIVLRNVRFDLVKRRGTEPTFLTVKDNLITNEKNQCSASLGPKQNKFIESLYGKKPLSLKALVAAGIYSDGSGLSHGKDALNKRLKEKLKITDDLIQSEGTGYFLNTKYDISLEK